MKEILEDKSKSNLQKNIIFAKTRMIEIQLGR